MCVCVCVCLLIFIQAHLGRKIPWLHRERPVLLVSLKSCCFLFPLPTQAQALSAALSTAGRSDSLPPTNLIHPSAMYPLMTFLFSHVTIIQMKADPVLSTCVVKWANYILTNYIICLLMDWVKTQVRQFLFREPGLGRSEVLEEFCFSDLLILPSFPTHMFGRKNISWDG